MIVAHAFPLSGGNHQQKLALFIAPRRYLDRPDRKPQFPAPPLEPIHHLPLGPFGARAARPPGARSTRRTNTRARQTRPPGHRPARHSAGVRQRRPPEPRACLACGAGGSCTAGLGEGARPVTDDVVLHPSVHAPGPPSGPCRRHASVRRAPGTACGATRTGNPVEELATLVTRAGSADPKARLCAAAWESAATGEPRTPQVSVAIHAFGAATTSAISEWPYADSLSPRRRG